MQIKQAVLQLHSFIKLAVKCSAVHCPCCMITRVNGTVLASCVRKMWDARRDMHPHLRKQQRALATGIARLSPINLPRHVSGANVAAPAVCLSVCLRYFHVDLHLVSS
jgi:hypothetical protein